MNHGFTWFDGRGGRSYSEPSDQRHTEIPSPPTAPCARCCDGWSHSDGPVGGVESMAVAPRCGVVVRDETFEAMEPRLTVERHSRLARVKAI